MQPRRITQRNKYVSDDVLSSGRPINGILLSYITLSALFQPLVSSDIGNSIEGLQCIFVLSLGWQNWSSYPKNYSVSLQCKRLNAWTKAVGTLFATYHVHRFQSFTRQHSRLVRHWAKWVQQYWSIAYQLKFEYYLFTNAPGFEGKKFMLQIHYCFGAQIAFVFNLFKIKSKKSRSINWTF